MAIIWSDRIIPVAQEKSWVCIYYKDNIPLTRCDDLCNLDSYLIIEIRLQSEKCILTCA